MSNLNGINISRLPGVGLQVTGVFRILRVSHGNDHIYWQPSYQAAMRASGPFSSFFPDPSFEEVGSSVVFSRHEGAGEILSCTRPIGGREQLPYAEWTRFEHAWNQFKLLALRDDVPEEVRDFIKGFSPPSISQFPEAYRIYKPYWYSRPRLLILWGLEPMGGAAFVQPDPQAAMAELKSRAPARASVLSVHPWLLTLVSFAAMAFAIIILWLAIQRPHPDFTLDATAGESSDLKNCTTFEPGIFGLRLGRCEYDWTFFDGLPPFSSLENPEVTWKFVGEKRVVLEARNSILFGCLYKTASIEKRVSVTEVLRPGSGGSSISGPLANESKNTPAQFPEHTRKSESTKGAKFDESPTGIGVGQKEASPAVRAQSSKDKSGNEIAAESSGGKMRGSSKNDTGNQKPDNGINGQGKAEALPEVGDTENNTTKLAQEPQTPPKQSSTTPQGGADKTAPVAGAPKPNIAAGADKKNESSGSAAKPVAQPGTPLGPTGTKADSTPSESTTPQITFEVVRQELDLADKGLHAVGMRFYAPKGVRITKVYVDGYPVSDSDSFDRKMKLGLHTIRVDFTIPSVEGPQSRSLEKSLNLDNQVKPKFEISDKNTTSTKNEQR